jgi:hypothetical protein
MRLGKFCVMTAITTGSISTSGLRRRRFVQFDQHSCGGSILVAIRHQRAVTEVCGRGWEVSVRHPTDRDGPDELFVVDGDFDDVGAGCRCAGKYADAQSRTDEASQRRDVCSFEGDRGRDVVPGAGVVEDFAQRVIGVEGDEWLVGNFVEADQLARREGMLLVHNGVELLGEQWLPGDVLGLLECHGVTETYVGDTACQVAE